MSTLTKNSPVPINSPWKTGFEEGIITKMIQVLYFASIKEKLGRESETFPYRPGMTLGDLLADVAEKHPGMKALTASKKFLYAVNQEVSPTLSPLADGDEVAILPPLSGGHD